jgi:hypothetical protein
VEGTEEVIFDHKKAGGIALYRPIGKTAGKESEEAIVHHIQRIEAEIAALDDTVLLRANGKSIRVKHTVLFTMLDGKCRKAYTQHLLKEKVAEGVTGLKTHGAKDKIDNMTCLICLAAPGTFHDEACLDKNPVFWELSRLLGVSSMHLKVRIMELIFHTAVAKKIKPELDLYRAELAADRTIKRAAMNKKVSEKKQDLDKAATIHFQKLFEGPLGKGLRLFVPEPQKGGNSNTGVTANRFVFVFKVVIITKPLSRFFKNSAATALILEVPVRMIEAVWSMLKQLNSCNKMVQVDAYRGLARNVFNYWMEDFADYKNMTANLHLLISHTPDWIQ